MSKRLPLLIGHGAELDYHRRLLRDPVRMDAFDRALRQVVRTGDVVLDAGAGTGVLAMLAARRGASRVYAVEVSPIASLARSLIAHNGLDGIVTVLEGDLRTLPPSEPVDVLVSEFLGRFLVDDGMIDAVRAAGAWLRPGGRCIPRRVRMWVAPVEVAELDGVAAFQEDLLGLDLSAALPHALSWAYPVALDPHALLGPPALYEDTALPALALRLDTSLELPIERQGRLRGVAGWVEADLAEGVTLSTEPGIETHWGQYLFPLPEIQVEPGDRLALRLWMDEEPVPEWCWEATLWRGERPLQTSTHETRRRDRPIPAPAPVPADVRGWLARQTQLGVDAFLARDLASAVAAFGSAIRALRPEDDDVAAVLYENLGLALYQHGRLGPAGQAFRRALDGGRAREPSLRMLVSCDAQLGRFHDAAREVADYEARFGPHPDGWTAVGLAGCCGGNPALWPPNVR